MTYLVDTILDLLGITPEAAKEVELPPQATEAAAAIDEEVDELLAGLDDL
jgi:hypothetical protein